MPKRHVALLLGDIRTAIDKIVRYAAGLDRDAFVAVEKTVDAIVRNLEIIGEAVRQIPAEFTAAHATVPWHRIAGLRNRIVHAYFGLDVEIIWQIVNGDLPALRSTLASLAPGS